ncbi:hypothetical protein GCM10009555_061180 [Acrocarpospora macrocephala]|uniref:Uncharacterized protein n=1 Tax=Acrocarpospora macrocephala TaxID=150177 RepID=A0A5M3WQK2_9ACTN|nr:hypothetical protein Amac_031570 [Acrocarpospora macrocephala]
MVIMPVRHHDRVEATFVYSSYVLGCGEARAICVRSYASINEYAGATGLDKDRRPADLIAAAEYLNPQTAIYTSVCHRPISRPVGGLNASNTVSCAWRGSRSIRHGLGVVVYINSSAW